MMATQTLTFEYPLGSGNILSVPPSVFQQISSGYRVGLPQNMYFDIPLGLDVWTSDGFYAPYQLLEDPSDPKYLLLNEGLHTQTLDSVEPYVGAVSFSTMQQRKFQVQSVVSITTPQLKLNISYGNFSTTTTPVDVFLCALLQDPCGIKYVLPIVAT